jgi:hypothetical protein
MDVVTLKQAKQYTDLKINSVDANKIYGVYWDKSSNPVLTRTNDSVGMVANAGVGGAFVQNDFDKAQIYREIGPVVDTLGNAFIRIPKFYIKKTDGVNFKTWQISKTQYPGFYLPWCFWDFTNSAELDYFDYAVYPASKAATKLQSVSGAYPLVSDTIVNFRTYAQNNNAGGLLGYQQLDLHSQDVLDTLFYIEFATLNSQSIMAGYTNGQYDATHTATVAETGVNRIILANAKANLYAVGQGFSVGTSLGGNQIFTNRTITSIDVYDGSNKAISFDGAPVNIAIGNIAYNTAYKNGETLNVAASSGSLINNSSGLCSCKYRGIENPWGNVWQFIDGLNINNNQGWVCANAAQYASNVFASPYEQLSYVNANANGYVKSKGYDPLHPFMALPIDATGSSSTYYSDYYYQALGQYIALLGGGWYSGTRAGLSCWDLGDSSAYAYLYLGGRLLKKAL